MTKFIVNLNFIAVSYYYFHLFAKSYLVVLDNKFCVTFLHICAYFSVDSQCKNARTHTHTLAIKKNFCRATTIKYIHKSISMKLAARRMAVLLYGSFLFVHAYTLHTMHSAKNDTKIILFRVVFHFQAGI